MEIDIKNGGHVILCGNRDNIEEIRKNLEDYITKPNFIDFEGKRQKIHDYKTYKASC